MILVRMKDGILVSFLRSLLHVSFLPCKFYLQILFVSISSAEMRRSDFGGCTVDSHFEVMVLSKSFLP